MYKKIFKDIARHTLFKIQDKLDVELGSDGFADSEDEILDTAVEILAEDMRVVADPNMFGKLKAARIEVLKAEKAAIEAEINNLEGNQDTSG